MSGHRISACRQCGESGNVVRISKAGYCPACGAERLLLHNAQQMDKTGPGFDKWEEAWLAAIPRMLPYSTPRAARDE